MKTAFFRNGLSVLLLLTVAARCGARMTTGTSWWSSTTCSGQPATWPRRSSPLAARRWPSASAAPRHWYCVIAMTANAWDEDPDQCLAAGMDDFVTKPVDPQVLYRTVMRWCRVPAGMPPAEPA